jgi:thiamine pyrophosphate-dependent acetolactate synthase large subunit-like protein
MLALPQDPRLHPGTALPGIDHLAAARAYGAGGTMAHTAQEAATAVERALADKRLEVVSVPVAEIRP